MTESADRGRGGRPRLGTLSVPRKIKGTRTKGHSCRAEGVSSAGAKAYGRGKEGIAEVVRGGRIGRSCGIQSSLRAETWGKGWFL